VTIGFGVNEDPIFRRDFSKQGSTLQLSSTTYWYQVEPHAPLPTVPIAADRTPAPEEAFWPDKENLLSAEQLKRRGVKIEMLCGRPGKEVIFAERQYGAVAKKGYVWSGWSLPVYHARAGNDETVIELTVPKEAAGLVRVFVIDPDSFEGGRKQTMNIVGEDLGTVQAFQDGKWLEQPVASNQTADGKVIIRAVNARKGANAVISIVEWIEK
jgi:hypothetical protein